MTVDYEKWPVFTQALLFVLMFVGGMAGSTAGGMKQVRALLMARHVRRQIQRFVHPHGVTSIKLNGSPVWGFVFLFLVISASASMGMGALGVDMATPASIAAMSNVGPAPGAAGPAENFASISVAGKWIPAFCMLVGRLEVYTVVILFMPQFWRK